MEAFIKPFMKALLQCSLSMSIITLLYAALLPILSKRYAPKWRYLLWLVIAVGWLIPFRPAIPLPRLPVEGADTPGVFPQVALPPMGAILRGGEGPTVVPEAVSRIPRFSVEETCFFLWLVGVGLMLLVHLWRHRRFINMVNRWSEAETGPEIRQLLDTLKEDLGIQAPIEYKTCPGISSPMMIGFLRPVILMPPIQLSKDELTLILRHELTHFKQHDLWYKVLVLGATLLHWFNPVVYLMARATSVQCEMACDALVLANENMSTRKQYGETILAVVRGGRAHQTVLSTNFYGGKKGMKNRLLSMLDSKGKKTGIIMLCVVLAGILLTGATLAAQEKPSTFIRNTAFTQEEFDQLLALRFEGYKEMTVGEFQERVWKMIDTLEYMALLERFTEDVQLQEMKDTNEIASFLFYELIPLTAFNWSSRDFLAGDVTHYEDAHNAQFDFTCTMNILDPDRLTVGEYSSIRQGVMEEFLTFFRTRTKDALEDEQGMWEALDGEVERLIKKWSTDSLSVGLEYFYLPLIPYGDSQPEDFVENKTIEEQEYPPATAEDYQELLKLKTPDYQSRTLADFNEDLLEWANDHYREMERITRDIFHQKFDVALSQEELSFITLTVKYSGAENGTMLKSNYTGTPREAVIFSDFLPIKTLTQEGRIVAEGYLDYEGTYYIKDDRAMTVGERDRCISGVLNAVRKYWDSIPLEELLAMKDGELIAKLEEIVAAYSTDHITFSILPEQTIFQSLDERSSYQ